MCKKFLMICKIFYLIRNSKNSEIKVRLILEIEKGA